MNSIRYLIVPATLLVLIISINCFAHTDPVGDVHPAVIVEKGRFSVYFSNNSKRQRREPQKYRMIYSKTGDLIVPRHNVATVPEKFVRVWNEDAPVKSIGPLKVRVDRNGESVEITNATGKTTVRRLLWQGGEMPFHDFHDSAVSSSHLVLIGTIQRPDGKNYPRTNLALATFELDASEPPRISILGEVATIYYFPTCSNLVQIGGRFYVAWMCNGPGKSGDDLEKITFNLTSLDATRDELATQVLDAEYRWNTNISMAAIDEHLCIAWHDGRGYNNFLPSNIRTLFISTRKN